MKIRIILFVTIVITLIGCKMNSKIKTKTNRGVDSTRTNTYEIVYDFKTGKYDDNNNRLEVNTPVVFKIKNINRLAYDVNVTVRDSILGASDLTDVADVLKKNEIEKLKNELKNEIISSEKIVTNVTPAVLQSGDIIVSNATAQDKKKIREIANTFTNDYLVKIDSSAVAIMMANNKTTLNQLNKSIDSVSIKKIKVEKGIEEAEILSNHLEAQKNLGKTYLGIVSKYKIILDLSQKYIIITSLMENPLLDLEDLNKSEIDKIEDSFNDNRMVFSEISILFKQFEKQYNALKNNTELGRIANYGGVIKLNYAIDSQNEEVIAIRDQINKIDFEKLRKEVTQLKQLVNSKNKEKLFEYISKPIQPYQDVVVFNINIKKKNNGLYENNKSFSHKEFTKFGLRLDVSLGMAGSLHAKKYSYDLQFDNNGINRIIKKDKDIFTPSFVGFFTTSYRSASHWTGGLSFGVGISADNGTIAFDNFFIGPSLIIGKYERATFTAGISLKSLPRLNSGYNVGDSLPNQSTIDNVSTKAYRAGVFVGVSYNLTKGVKDNIKYLKNFMP